MNAALKVLEYKEPENVLLSVLDQAIQTSPNLMHQVIENTDQETQLSIDMAIKTIEQMELGHQGDLRVYGDGFMIEATSCDCGSFTGCTASIKVERF